MENRGVCFIAKVPPKMSITKIRELLQPYGIDRVYFEPATKKGSFTEGWVEFLDRKVAKMTALSLNGTPMIQKKRSQFTDHTWQIKFLKGFSWDDLNENFQYEKRQSKEKLNLEMNQARKVHDFYLENQLKKVKQ